MKVESSATVRFSVGSTFQVASTCDWCFEVAKMEATLNVDPITVPPHDESCGYYDKG